MRASFDQHIDIGSLPVPSFWELDSNPQKQLIGLERTLSRLEIDRDFMEDDFRQALSDIETAMSGFANPGIASVQRLQSLDLAKLSQCPSGPKPRISLTVQVTDGHLSCQWHPHQYSLNGTQFDCDEWMRNSQRSGELFRPSNEILFVRNAEKIMMRPIQGDTFTRWLCSSLIAMTYSTWNAIQQFLRRTIRVQLRDGLAVAEARASELGIDEIEEVYVNENKVAVQLSIVDGLERERIRIGELVEDFSRRHLMSIEQFYGAVQNCSENGVTDFSCVERTMTSQGNSNFSAEYVADLFYDIGQALRSGLWRPDDKIISLRR